MKREYAACKAGEEQSPIDIHPAAAGNLPAIEFDYKDSPIDIVNTGHTLQMNYSAGSSITVGGERYELRQLHFHHPSEEHIEGKAFDMVIHLVHANSKGELAVVAVLVREGGANETLQKLWSSFPAAGSVEKKAPGVRINAAGLLPAGRAYYTYRGSLTTPPCTEGVTWFILKAPIEASQDQVNAFAAIFPHNARPIQPLGARTVRSTR